MATARIVLDTRKQKQDGSYPVKIRVSDNKNAQRIGTTISLSESDFEKMMKGTHLKGTLLKYRNTLDELLVKANKIIESLEPFNFKTFTTRFNQKGNRSNLIFLLNEKANKFRDDENFSSYNLYKQTASILINYINLNNTNEKSSLEELPLNAVTATWLNNFEKWAINVPVKRKIKGSKNDYEVRSKYSRTTIGMYLIRVRSIFNEAISTREINPNLYPFHKADNRLGYKIPKASNNKRALNISEIMLIFNYQPVTENEQFAKDVFIFSYLASGINPIDIFKLKWNDIEGDKFTFIRTKTAKKTGGTNKITVRLNPQLKEIIYKYKSDATYVFNVIKYGDSELQIKTKTTIKIAAINANLKKISAKLNITEEISLYYARHSFSTNLMNNNAPIAFISKQLGHTDIKTTQAYLDSFSADKVEEYESKLLDLDSINNSKTTSIPDDI
ncbi:tyrosine-type recombinase/integrase [Pedobacter helvus]|uniref:Tyrosine-type recombinase/integrase n=1 Tax=Pedobacter helvus TaxID=2563444 RepID=A0ABW9JFY5_9SPHI|nr:tyrosine-type recombinase/integrase [Pedobacter ureilyticus]